MLTVRPSLSSSDGRAPMTSASPPTLANGNASPAIMKTSGRRDMLSVDEFFCALGCANNRLDEGDAETAFFQFEDAVHGTAGRRCNEIFELCGMLAGLDNHARCAENHLGRKL